MNKYRTWTPPATETLDTPVLEQIVDTLFPRGVERSTLEWGPGFDGPHDITEDLEISSEELARAVRRIGSRKAPGPDGIPGKIWVRALGFLGERLRHLYNPSDKGCLRQGVFPQEGQTGPSFQGRQTGKYSVGLSADMFAGQSREAV